MTDLGKAQASMSAQDGYRAQPPRDHSPVFASLVRGTHIQRDEDCASLALCFLTLSHSDVHQFLYAPIFDPMGVYAFVSFRGRTIVTTVKDASLQEDIRVAGYAVTPGRPLSKKNKWIDVRHGKLLRRANELVERIGDA